jgi:hypothetical protein
MPSINPNGLSIIKKLFEKSNDVSVPDSLFFLINNVAFDSSRLYQISHMNNRNYKINEYLNLKCL